MDVDTIRFLPTPVSVGLTFTGIDAAVESPTCALDSRGSAYCWGRGQFGKLGNGSTADAATPVPVSGGRLYQIISAGRNRFCAIDNTNDAYCWGYNAEDQTGDNSGRTEVLAPALVTGSLKWRQISAGERHSCGVTLAGDGYCWGRGEDGRLGTGSMDDMPVPALVAGNLKWRMISAGSEHSCGVTLEGSSQMC
jgi:alpha-tubulin suppressor-like RCC1 family protein